MKLILGLISLAAILSMLVPASVLGQGEFSIFITDDDAIHQLDLKATEGQNGQVNEVSGFAVEANSVVQINQNDNLQVFTSTNEPTRIEKVKVTDQSNQLIELTKVGNEWSLQGFDDGVYLLDVIVNMPNGEKGAFETVLVILAPNTQNADPNQVIKQVVKTDTKVVFRDQKPKPKPSICYFDPDNRACDPDPKTKKCPPGFGFNENERCIPIGKCPSGYGRLDDDETGKCYSNHDIKRCPDGYVTHKLFDCPPPLTLVPKPVTCPAGQELSSDGLSCAPPCDGSYQDCIYNGYLCKAGSTEHACEVPPGQSLAAQPSVDCTILPTPPECDPAAAEPPIASDCTLVPSAPGCAQTFAAPTDEFAISNEIIQDEVPDESAGEENESGDDSGNNGDEGGGDEGGGDEGGGDEGGGDEEAGAEEE